MRHLLIGGLLILALAVGIGLRFADLANNPGGLYVDEAAEALSAQRILHDPGFRPLFLPEGGGREAPFAYAVAAGFGLFGESVVVLRGVAALIGVLGVGAIWLLARRFGTVAGLAAAAWAATSLWLVCISRDGMRNTMVPLFEALALLAILAWQERPSRFRGALAGAAVAFASLYTYQPLKLMPLLVAAWLLWLARRQPATFSPLRPTLVATAVGFVGVAAPMLIAAASDAAAYFGRAAGVSLLATHADLADHWLRTIGMFAFTGDPNPRHDVGELPLLGVPLTLVAVLGVARAWARRAKPGPMLVLMALPTFLLPPLLATEGGAPHFLRSLGLAVPLAVLVGLGVAEAHARVTSRLGGSGGRLVAAAAIAGFAALGIGGGRAYLERPLADRYAAFSDDLVAMARLASPGDVVVLDDYSAGVVRFLDADALPGFVPPGVALAAAPATGAVLARSLVDLEAAVGAGSSAGAEPAARDPNGVVTVWRLPAGAAAP